MGVACAKGGAQQDNRRWRAWRTRQWPALLLSSSRLAHAPHRGGVAAGRVERHQYARYLLSDHESAESSSLFWIVERGDRYWRACRLSVRSVDRSTSWACTLLLDQRSRRRRIDRGL